MAGNINFRARIATRKTQACVSGDKIFNYFPILFNLLSFVEINQNSYFKVDTISGGLEIIWNFESLFLISYKNLLTSESLLVPVNNQRTGAHFLGDLDPCTPYEFQSYLPDTNQPNATQIVTIVMQPESEQEKYDPIWFSLSRYA